MAWDFCTNQIYCAPTKVMNFVHPWSWTLVHTCSTDVAVVDVSGCAACVLPTKVVWACHHSWHGSCLLSGKPSHFLSLSPYREIVRGSGLGLGYGIRNDNVLLLYNGLCPSLPLSSSPSLSLSLSDVVYTYNYRFWSLNKTITHTKCGELLQTFNDRWNPTSLLCGLRR